MYEGSLEYFLYLYKSSVWDRDPLVCSFMRVTSRFLCGCSLSVYREPWRGEGVILRVLRAIGVYNAFASNIDSSVCVMFCLR